MSELHRFQNARCNDKEKIKSGVIYSELCNMGVLYLLVSRYVLVLS